MVTDEALTFVAELERRFGERRRELLKARTRRGPLGFLEETREVRESDWSVAPPAPGLELREPHEWELCCGSAGVYNLLKPEPAAELGERKARNLRDTGAEAVAAANPGCAVQIAAYAPDLPVYHPMEILHWSLKKR